MAGSFIQAVGQALNKKGGWTDPSKLTRNKQDAEIKKLLRVVDNLVLEEHFRLLGRLYLPSRKASKPGEYPKVRSGKLQGFLLSKIQLPKKGIRSIKYEYLPEIDNKGHKYANYMFSNHPKGKRKGIYNVILKLKSKINKIMGTKNGVEAIKF